jgi:phosphatidate cytidylyltransferase
VFAEQMLRARTADAVRRVAVTLLAVVYLGAGAALLVATRTDFGVPALLLVLAAVKFTDIGAYFTGSFFGRHKLIPWLSPGKSWEGLAGGLAAGAGIAMLAAAVLGPETLTLAEAALLGVVLGLAGQFADLCESLLKRSADVKDAGAVVPEFGGVLDILDSPLLAAPVGYALLAAFG